MMRNATSGALLAAILTGGAVPAHAVDACKFLLCIAGPWQSISQCVPTVREVLAEMALGRPFPTCAMASGGAGASNRTASQATCPAWYRRYNNRTGVYEGCMYSGQIDVRIDGALWSTVNWNMAGGTSTWYSDAARQAIGADAIDTRYDTDKAVWEAKQRPLQQSCDGGDGC